MAAMGIGRLRRIFAGTTPTQRPSSSARRRQGRPNKCSVWPDAIGFFSHGLSGAILQGPPLRPRVQCCPPPSFWLEWGANHLPPLPTLSFQRIDADTAGQPRRSDTRQGNRPQGLSAARLPSTRLPARVVLEQNVSPFEPLPPDSPSHSQQAALEFLSGRTLDLLCTVYSGLHHQWWRARLHAAAQHGTAPP